MDLRLYNALILEPPTRQSNMQKTKKNNEYAQKVTNAEKREHADKNIFSRFKPALPAPPWHGVKDATHFGNYCPNVQLLTGFVAGSEDCLFLNV